jgi:hypothetical protein
MDFDAYCYMAALVPDGINLRGPSAACGIYPQPSTTSVTRTLGWHLLDINALANSLSFSIDGAQVFNATGDYSFDTVTINVSGPGFRPNTVAYFDDFAFIPAIPPSITSLTATPDVLWPPNRKMVPVSLAVSATGSPTPVCQISSVSSNEPIVVPGETDWAVTGPLALDLRAERLGSGDGRVYVITVTCTNTLNPSASQTVAVSVPHDQGQR